MCAHLHAAIIILVDLAREKRNDGNGREQSSKLRKFYDESFFKHILVIKTPNQA